MNIKSLKKQFYRTLFPPRFENEKVKKLYEFISENDSTTDFWEMGGLLSQFIRIIEDFNEDDIQYFFQTIHLWDGYHLVIIADKLMEKKVKENVNYDLGKIYFKIFLSYEKLDSYYLLDNLELIFKMYHSKLDMETLISIASKIKFLYQNKQITRQQFDQNMSYINNLNHGL
ncbi:hypothetical protein CEY12_21845 [Chryseobacterium sp. T16E-39]|uniref:hypothetical protein n=1 Tax=Chryseobacterium sp. T16E-39 TaxID=2015076 RepID=UPI000B5B3CB7|nr:hypothetical protein [Chryseobacterium sp. T16E-39]ASK32565.1 hypothetical protein CEY12_21845 [Chryseobacterium sp. T16E-39]